MTAETDAVLKRLLDTRRNWITLANGMQIRYRRPVEAEYSRFREGSNGIEHVCYFVDGWKGVTEAHLLGPEIGSSDEIAFDGELWSAYIRDNVQEASVIAQAIIEAMNAHEERRGRASKN